MVWNVGILVNEILSYGSSVNFLVSICEVMVSWSLDNLRAMLLVVFFFSTFQEAGGGCVCGRASMAVQGMARNQQ